MNFIKVTMVKKDDIIYVPNSPIVPVYPLSNYQYASSSSVSAYISGGESTEYIKPNEIERISNNGKETKIYTKSWGEMIVKETAEQIFQMLHNKEFSVKMDKLLE